MRLGFLFVQTIPYLKIFLESGRSTSMLHIPYIVVYGISLFSYVDMVISFIYSSEPIGAGWERAQEIIKEKSGGKMAIEVYPDSQLGDKSSLIDSMLLGEPVCTLADGAFYADYGIKDMGILFGPFLFDDWDQCWTLIESDWYEDQCKKLEEKGLKIIASNWMYGERHTLTNVPVNSVDDLKGLKIRVPSNEIQSYGFDVLGATSTGMALGDVYQALQTKTIDGAENPIATLYGRKLHEVAPYLILDGHVKNFTTWVVSADWFNICDDLFQWSFALMNKIDQL